MLAQYIHSRNCKPIVGASSVWSLLATFCTLSGAAVHACSLLSETAWLTVSAVRSVIWLAGWQAVSAYLSEDSRLLQHELRIVRSLWPLFHFVASCAK